MAPLSLREAWLHIYKNPSPAAGLRALRNDFYRSKSESPPYESLQSTFPYPTLRSLLAALHWPASDSYSYTTSDYDYPKEQDHAWMQKLQGVAHDGANWYFSNQYGLHKFPVTQDLSSADSDTFPSAPIPGDLWAPDSGGHVYDHYGDIDYYNGYVYAPLELQHKPDMGPGGISKPGERTSKILLFDSNLIYKGSANIPAQWEAPWCAVNPLNGLLYSSNFDIDDAKGPLRVYRPSIIANTTRGVVGLELTHLGNFQLFDELGQMPLVVNQVQGGAFSRPGHLYLVSDATFIAIDPILGPLYGPGGVTGFDMVTGRRIIDMKVDYQRWKDYGVTTKRWQELEGITIWDVDGIHPPHIGGQIHVIMVQQDIPDDDLFFKHYTVKNSEEKKAI